MKKKPFGRTSLSVSELCLDLQSFEGRHNEEHAFALLDAFQAAGGNFVQASVPCPGFPLVIDAAGLPETHLGRWMQIRKVPRSDLRLSLRLTVHRPFSRAASVSAMIREAVEASLRRLNTDHLDYLFLEWTETLLPLEETFATVERLIQAGQVRAGAVSGFPNWRVTELMESAGRATVARPEAMQIDFSLLHRGHAQREAQDLAREHRLALLARTPLARGRLARPPKPTAFGGYTRTGRVLDVLSRCARARGVSAAQIAHAWVLAAPAVTAMVIRPRTVAHLNEAVAATRLALTSEELFLLDDVSFAPAPHRPRRSVGSSRLPAALLAPLLPAAPAFDSFFSHQILHA